METPRDQDRIEKVVDLAAPPARVWHALTDHEEFGEWFRVRLDNPFVVGEITTGNITYPGYEHMVWESLTECLQESGRQASAKDSPTKAEKEISEVQENRATPVREQTFDITIPHIGKLTLNLKPGSAVCVSIETEK